MYKMFNMPQSYRLEKSKLANDSINKLLLFQKSLHDHYFKLLLKGEDVSECINEFTAKSAEWEDFCHSITLYNERKDFANPLRPAC